MSYINLLLIVLEEVYYEKKTVLKIFSTLVAGLMSISNFSFYCPATRIYAVSTENNNVTKVTENGTKILNGDVNGDGVIDDNDSENVLKVKLSDCPQADVNADGKLDQTDADMINSYTTGEINYFPVGTYYDEKPGYLTRGEWIHNLIEGFEMSAASGSELQEFYTDLSEYEYGSEITLAANFGVFDVLGDKFNPNEYVTRDFAAHTMNFCLGYPNDVAISFTDADAVYYDGDAQVAVNKGWFALENKEFHPSLYVKAVESDIAFKEMHDTYKSTQIDENHKDVVEYADSVIRMTDAKSASIDGTTVKVTRSSKTINDGDNFTFVVDGVEIIRKATDAWLDEDSNTWTIETEDADEGAILSCDSEGYGEIDYNSIEVLCEGLDVNFEDDTESNNKESTLIKNYYAAPPRLSLYSSSLKKIGQSGNLDLKKTKISINGKIPIDDLSELNIEGSIKNIKMPYSIELGASGIKNLYIGFNSNIDVKASLGIESKLPKDDAKIIELFRYDLVGNGHVIGITCTVYAVISISGKVSIQYSFNSDVGIGYSNGSWRPVKNFTGQHFHLEVEAEEKLGLKVALEARVANKSIGEFYISGGEKGKISLSGNSNVDNSCVNINAYVFAEFGAKFELTKHITFKASYEFINNENSPLRLNLHLENGVIVPACTKGLNYVSITDTVGGGSNGGGASGGYVSGYGYGTGYAGGTHGPAWLGKYYASTITFKELEPALVISEDRMLTDDLEVETDLVLHARLDLNGHKLTVKKSLYVGDSPSEQISPGNYDGYNSYWNYTGELVLNKGTAMIGGDLSETSHSNIVMNNKTDKICVDGNVDLNGDTSFTAGTIEIKGDISGRLESSDMHIVLLSGTGNQNISGNGINANVLDINNSDSRTITIDSTLRADSSTTIDGKTLHLICNESRNDESYVSLKKLNADKLIIDGNVTLGNLEYRGSEITINGDLLGSDSMTLYKTKVIIDGDAVTGGDFNFNGSSITIKGDYHHNGLLYMKNRNDKLTIEGDLHLEGTGDSIQDGIIDVKGDIRFSHIIHTFIFERYNELCGNNKVIFSGDKDVTVYMDGGNFNDIEFQNSDKRTLNTDDTFKAKSINCEKNPLNISTRNGALSLGTVTCSDFKVYGDCTLIGETKFVCDSITFDGDISTGNNWDVTSINLNGKPTTINGSLTNNETFYLNGATLTIKEDFNMPEGFLFVSKSKLYVLGDMTVDDGLITMKDNSDLIDVKGDFNLNCNVYNSGGYGVVSAGTIQCSGDYSNKGDYPLKMNGTSKLILNGGKDQVVHTKDSANQIIIENSANKKLIIKGNFAAKELSADNDTLAIESNGGIINGAKLKCDLDINGNVILENADEYYGNTCVFDINGHNVNINGSLYQHSSEIALNNGKLSIVDDYLIVRDEDSAAQTVSEGKLNMTHDNDNVIVGGKFVTMTNVNHSELLTAGIMEIKRDFYQYDDGTEFAFPASGTHQAILSGQDKQNITFESYDSSHFNNIKITNEEEQYNFSPEPCWNKLETGVLSTTSTTLVTTTSHRSTTTSTTSTTTTRKLTTSTVSNTTTTSVTSVTTMTSRLITISTISNTTTLNNDDFKLTITSITLNNGNQYEIPLNYSDVIYKSTNRNVAVVSPKGIVTAVGEGEAIINIIDKDYNVIQLKISVKAESSDSNEYKLGDINNDEQINSVDASSVLAYYARISTNQEGGYDEKQILAADVNNDGSVNSVDASKILAYYAYVSTTKEEILSIEEYLKK